MTFEELKALLEEQGLDKQWKKNSDYWKKRFELLEDALNNKGIEYYHDLERMYQKAANETEKEIAKWYRRYATTEGISFAEARKQLNTNELKEFRMSLKEYIEKGESLDPQWKRQLEHASTKFHITRLEALKMQMQHQVEVLMGNEAEGVYDLVKGFYTDAYYHSIYEIQKGIGVGFDFAKLDSNAIDKALSKPWTADGMNFSERIWGKHRPELIKKLHDGLTLNIARGESPDKLIADITKAFNVKKSQAANLVQTEKAFFQTTAQYDSFKELDVEMYEITATLDSKTSEICRKMDGKTFSMKDFQPGATAPPFHNRCRTAIAPYFDDEFDFIDERAARDGNGQYYTVPSSMKYKEWYEEHVSNNPKYLDVIKKATNAVKDKALFETFKETLGSKNVPKSFESFQEIKYNNTKEWDSLKNEFDVISKIDKKDFTDEYKQKLKDVFYNLKAKGFDAGYHSLGRIVGQKKSKGKRLFTFDELIDILNKPVNYLEEPNRTVKYYDEIGVIQNASNHQIVSIVTRKKAKEGWKPYEHK